jgi:hypothetical protein
MKKVYVVVGFVLAIALQGCATPANTSVVLQQDDKSKFMSAKVASSYFMAKKTVYYSEVLYRVLWVENRSSSKDFSGIWQPDDELLSVVNEQLSRESIHAVKLTDVVAQNTLKQYYYSQLRKDFEPYVSGDHANTPVVEYLDKYPEYTGFETIRQELMDHNVKYLFEVLSAGAFGNAIGFGSVIVGSGAFMRIIDLEQRKVVWSGIPVATKMYQLGGDLNKLEANNLALLKEGVALGLKRAMSGGVAEVIGKPIPKKEAAALSKR